MFDIIQFISWLVQNNWHRIPQLDNQAVNKTQRDCFPKRKTSAVR